MLPLSVKILFRKTKKNFALSGWGDSNSRPLRPERSALTGLRYTPIPRQFEIRKIVLLLVQIKLIFTFVLNNTKMKKLNVLLFLSFLLLNSISFQAKSQCIEKGNYIFEAFYGGPNLWSNVLEASYISTNSIDVKPSNIGPLGLRAEYLISDRLGLGIDILYSRNAVFWKDEDFFTPGSYFSYKVSVPRIRLTPRLNFHFTSTDRFDIYGAFGAGYKNTRYILETDDPDYEDTTESALIPISLRIGLGARFFFTENIGVGAEIGIGGAFATFGVAIKL
jgi:hypothetical protein